MPYRLYKPYEELSVEIIDQACKLLNINTCWIVVHSDIFHKLSDNLIIKHHMALCGAAWATLGENVISTDIDRERKTKNGLYETSISYAFTDPMIITTKG